MEDFRSPEDLFRDHTEKIRNAGKQYGRFAPFIAMAALIVLGAQSSVYSIGPDEVGVVTRFGQYVRTTDPGLHAKLPFGAENVVPIKVKKIFKEEFGFRTSIPGVRSIYAEKKYPDESLMLTGDLNMLDVRWIVQYRVRDPFALLFNTKNPVDNVRAFSEVVMRRLCGDYSVDEVLTAKREEVAALAQKQLQVLLDKYGVGIDIVTFKLMDVNPPDEVKPAFNEVNEARQERERMINEAWEEYNNAVPAAKGEAIRTINQAEGYAMDKVNRAKGEAERFLETWKAYKAAPDITRKRMYLETLSNVLPRSRKKIVVDPEQRSILPLLRLDGESKGVE